MAAQLSSARLFHVQHPHSLPTDAASPVTSDQPDRTAAGRLAFHGIDYVVHEEHPSAFRQTSGRRKNPAPPGGWPHCLEACRAAEGTARGKAPAVS